MSVPDHRHVPVKLHQTGLYDLKTEHGQGAFTDAVVATLHGLDDRWGHLKKTGGATHVHGHGEDSALYLSDEPGQSQAVDFIGGAGGPNPQPGWIVDTPRYSASDWLDPFDHGLEGEPVPEPSQPYPSESPNGGWWGQVFDVEVAQRYALKNRVYPDPADPRSLRWCGRTSYDIRAGLTKEESLRKHLEELEQELGLP